MSTPRSTAPAASPASRDPFLPPPRGEPKRAALGLALLAHLLLIGALAFGVNWHSFEPTPMAAELWSAVPQAAAPRAVEPPPVTPPPEAAKKPDPVVKAAEPRPAPPPAPDPQIAIETARREDARRAQAADDAASRQRATREKEQQLAQKKSAADKLKADRDAVMAEKAARDRDEALKADKAEKAEKTAKAEAAKRDAAAREAYLKRIQGLAGATGGATDTGAAARSSGPSASYAGRIMARIKPNIVFNDALDGNPIATVEVRLAPDGTIVAKRLVKSSGVKSWDDAVLRAIERTEVLPRDVDGRVPPPFQIDFKLRG